MMTSLNYYVYIYYSADWVAYYIGKGFGRRCYQRHDVPIPDKDYIHRFYFHTEQEAFDTEIQLIAHFGRICDGGTLMNQTLGGPGKPGISPSEETRAKQSAALKGRKLTEEHCAKLRGRKHTEESRAKLRESHSRTIPVWFVSPEQTVHEVRSVTQFARHNDLFPSSLNRVSSGQRFQHKGWKLHPSSPHLKCKQQEQ